MSAGADLLRVENLQVSFSLMGGKIDAVRSASLRILPGKVTALVGESGSGKSVIGQTIMGIQPKTASVLGNVLFSDPAAPTSAPINLLQLPQDGRQMRAIRGNRIGLIFQEPMTSFSPLHTIGNQVDEALRIHSILSPAERLEKMYETMDLVGFSDPKKICNMYPFELSGGMRQRAMIAMALICRPALLIADEPTTALDVTIQAQILKLLRDLQSRLNMGMLLITHDLGVVANIADEVAVIYQGEIMEAGTVDEIFRAPSHPYLKGLMAAVPHFDMKPGDRLKALREVTIDKESLIGKKTASVNKAPGVLLSVNNISKTFTTRKSSWFSAGKSSPTKAVDGVSFDIHRGECLGLVGESGSGKTTVSKILMRAVRPDEGTITFHGSDKDIDVLNARDGDLKELRSRIQMVFQDPISSLSPRMTVGNILNEPLQIHDKGNAAYRAEKVRNLLKAIGLGNSALNRHPHSFSGGQRQRIGIARALALGPELLICDEPVSALDVSVQAQILNLLKDLQKELGLTYLFISHNLAVVDYMADRVAVMCEGKIVELAPRETIMRAPVHPYTKSLLAAVPFPDLDRPLDFNTIGKISATGKFDWGKQFRDEDNGNLVTADLGGGHLVLANGNADIRELRS
jgi:peptide/nickel transport system ATP-binding protein